MDSNVNKRKKLKRKPKGQKKGKSNKTNIKGPSTPYVFRDFISLNQTAIFAVKFDQFVWNRYVFAVTTLNQIAIMECVEPEEDNGQKDAIDFLTTYEGEKDENFFALAWSLDEELKHSLLCAGGKKGIIRVINTVNDNEYCLIGHTGAINDLQIHKPNRAILLSASEDRSCRLWNIKTEQCIVVFSGNIHRNQVLSVAFNANGTHFVSGGMDHAIAIWKIDTCEIQKAITDSFISKNFMPVRVYGESFSTFKVHDSFVDSIIWFGENSFISRSQNGDIAWWKTGGAEESELIPRDNQATKLYEFKKNDSEENRVWFLRMELDPPARYLCIGDILGKISFYDLDSENLERMKVQVVSHGKSTTLPRMISFSPDSKIMVTCSEDGKVIRWDKR